MELKTCQNKYCLVGGGDIKNFCSAIFLHVTKGSGAIELDVLIQTQNVSEIKTYASQPLPYFAFVDHSS
jgi:hypothetical protein